nr:hypothetical protein [Tanacetum cinerariifolium]
GTIKTSNSLSKGIMWHRPILHGLGKRNHTEDLNLYALNATTIMMDNVLPSAPTARGLAISLGTVEAILLLPTTKDPKGQFKEFSLALSVELRAILRSFMSTAFSSLIDIIPTTLDHGYDVELADATTKTQKYLLKGCYVFLAHVTAKKAEDKSEEKRLEDVPIF